MTEKTFSPPSSLTQSVQAWHASPQKKSNESPSSNNVFLALDQLSDQDFFDLLMQTAQNQGPLAVTASSTQSRVTQEQLQERLFLMIPERAPRLRQDQRHQLFKLALPFAPPPPKADPKDPLADQAFFSQAAYTEVLLDHLDHILPSQDIDPKTAFDQMHALLSELDRSLDEWSSGAEHTPLSIMRTQAARTAAGLLQQSNLSKPQVQTSLITLAARSSPMLPWVAKSLKLEPKAITQTLKAQWKTPGSFAGAAPALSALTRATTSLVMLLKIKERDEFLKWLAERDPKSHSKVTTSLKVKSLAKAKKSPQKKPAPPAPTQTKKPGAGV